MYWLGLFEVVEREGREGEGGGEKREREGGEAAGEVNVDEHAE